MFKIVVPVCAHILLFGTNTLPTNLNLKPFLLMNHRVKLPYRSYSYEATNPVWHSKS